MPEKEFPSPLARRPYPTAPRYVYFKTESLFIQEGAGKIENKT